mgnify:CR=1 FL=1|tara:strand:- start:657 stop:2867 length:2211 start_codon:yes stop_codon:yes gene_type:complete
MALTKIGSIGINTGIAFAGVTTITTLNGSDAVLSVGGTVNFVSDVSIGGSVSIGGTLTYEDVTNIDSVGLITARNGVVVGSGITLSKDGDIFATGISTVKGIHINGTLEGQDLKVGTGVTITRDGDIFATGISTFTEGFAGDVIIDDKIVHRGNTNTAIRFPEGNTISFNTSGNERIRIDNNGRLFLGSNSIRNVGGSSASSYLQLEGLGANASSFSLINNENSANSPVVRFAKTRGTSDGAVTTVADGDFLGRISFSGADGTDLEHNTAQISGVVNGTVAGNQIPTDITFATSPSNNSNRAERLRITKNGRLLIGDTTPRLFDGGNTPLVQVSDSVSGRWGRIASATYIDSTIGGGIILAHSRNSTVGSHTVLQDDDKLGSVFFEGSDGTQFARGAQIESYVDGAPGTDDMPGRLVFATTADGSSSPTERARITSDGRVLINSTVARNIGASNNRLLQIESSGGGAGLAVVRNQSTASGPSIDLGKSRGYPNTIVQSGDILGAISFSGADGTDLQTQAAQIKGEVDGTPGANDMPGRLVFATTADGAASPTAHWRIDSTGRLDQLNSSAGIRFQYGHSVTPNDLEAVLSNTLDDFESGDLDWEIHKDNGLTTGTNASGAHAKYVKIGPVVHIFGWIRTDGQTSTNNRTAVMTDGSGNRAQLPFTPSGVVHIPVNFTRSFQNVSSGHFCLGATHANDDLYIHQNQSNQYTPASDNCTLTNQTNLVIAFNGSYYTLD